MKSMKCFGLFLGLMMAATFAYANDTVTNATSKLIVACDSSTLVSTNGTAKLVSGATGRKIYVCGYSLAANGTTGVQFWYGTGATCTTGLVSLTGVMQVSANTTMNYGGNLGTVFVPIPPGNDFCVNTTTAATTLSGVVSWTQL